MEIVMIDKTVAALTAVLVLASGVTASAQPAMRAHHTRILAPGIRAYQTESPARNDGQYCYLPSESCDTEHMVTN
jgi:hypothetical protein